MFREFFGITAIEGTTTNFSTVIYISSRFNPIQSKTACNKEQNLKKTEFISLPELEIKNRIFVLKNN